MLTKHEPPFVGVQHVFFQSQKFLTRLLQPSFLLHQALVLLIALLLPRVRLDIGAGVWSLPQTWRAFHQGSFNHAQVEQLWFLGVVLLHRRLFFHRSFFFLLGFNGVNIGCGTTVGELKVDGLPLLKAR